VAQNVVTIATRESPLALWQAHHLRDQLQQAHAGLEVNIHGLTTQGDRWLQAPLSEVGGKGLFIKELEVAMLEGAADIAVHCIKDLPAELPDGFILPVVAYRAPVTDMLVGSVEGLDGLRHGAKVGSSSLRRKTQLLALRPDLNVMPIRGNVGSRLGKLDAGEFDAIVLATAGLQRLGIEREDCVELSIEQSLPAPGQGALGVECRADWPHLGLLEPLKDEQVALCIACERGVSLGLGADCSLPIAAYAELDTNSDLRLRALIGNADGTRILRSQAEGQDPQALAAEVVADLYAQGAQDILDSLSAAGA